MGQQTSSRRRQAASLLLGLVCHCSVVTVVHGAPDAVLAVPEAVTVEDGAFRSTYFGLTYPLPQGWLAGPPGPPPSQSGDYVLGMFAPHGELTGSITINAHDMFFSTVGDARSMATDARGAISGIEGMTIDREPEEIRIGGRDFYRLDYSGVGLYRTMLVTEIRCHLVTFNFTAPAPEMLDRLVHGFDHVSFKAPSDPGWLVPVCIKDFLSEDIVLREALPWPVGTIGTSIPVRIVFNADGQVVSIRVIRGTGEQKRNIENALQQWHLKADMVKSRGGAVETGFLVQAKPAEK
jgi:hypothetical protein